MSELRYCDSFALLQPKSAEDGDVIHAIASSDAVDRDNEVIEVGAFKDSLESFVQNGVILACHQHRLPDGSPPMIGVPVDAKYIGRKLKVSFRLGETELAQKWRKARADGTWRAVSVGFIPQETEWREYGRADSNGVKKRRLHHVRAELIELSGVPVGSNRDALLRGLIPDDFYERLQKLEKRVEDFDSRVAAGHDELIRRFRALMHEILTPDQEEYLSRLLDENLEGEKPYPNEHSCRLADPSRFDRVRRVNNEREHNGKRYHVIYGRDKNTGKWAEQAYRYDKSVWSASSARSHCKSHDGTFEAASGESIALNATFEKVWKSLMVKIGES